jgi:putative FmdB family regulatory protein
MPIFAYQCEACGHHFDELQKLGAEPLTQCPECGEASLQKLLSAPRFHLKGSGWSNSEEPKPKQRPKYMHTFDSPVPHAEHHSHDHDHSHDHGHKHDHDHKTDHKADHKAEHKADKGHGHDH